MESRNRRVRSLSVGVCVLCLLPQGTGAREQAWPSPALLAELSRSSLAPVRAHTDPSTGFVTTLLGRFEPDPAERQTETAARGFLARHADLFGLRGDLADLGVVRHHRDRGGPVVVFEQTHEGVPVFDGAVVVGFDSDGRILHVESAYVPDIEVPRGPWLDAAQALARAAEFLEAPLHAHRGGTRLVVVAGDKSAPGLHLAWEVMGFLEEPLGDWHVFVDARTGEVVRVLDLLKRAGAPCLPCDPVTAANCGRVFHQNPVDALGDPGLTDASNVDAAQQGCALSHLISPMRLDGIYANTSITAGRVGPPYDYFRSANEPAADEVNTYYHLNRAKEYLNSLGFPGVMTFSINADAHDPSLGDNAHYVPSGRYLEFGEGGVDDAQDQDIVYHEYGHAIQDNQVPGFGTTAEGGAQGEGFGDYWAASLTDDVFAPALGPACIAPWDATTYNPYNGSSGSGCLRRVDGAKSYPRDFVWEVHDDGEVWSAALWRLRQVVGGPIADPVVIKSHTFLTPSAGFRSAADALLSADQALYGGTHAPAIHEAMKAQGIPRTGTAAPSTGFTDAVPFVCETGHNYANLEYKECQYTQPGAMRIRFHFSSFNTESGVDFAYVSDADLREVEALSGTPFGSGGGSSAAVSGDTIVVRFKADGSIRRNGFRIDQVEYLPEPVTIPAGSVPDGDGTPGVPLRVARGPGADLALSWGASCVPDDTDYEVYEGTMGAFASHVPVVCSTGGLTTWTLTPAAGGRYYLVVPRNATAEGSYGKRSDGIERPQSAAACAPQDIVLSCP